MEKESRLQLGCALMTCLTTVLVLCAVGIYLAFGSAIRSFVAAGVSAPSASVERLAIVGDDGNVYTMDRNGGAKVSLTNDAQLERNAPVRRVYIFPNWSPDSQRIAFVGLSSENAGKAFLYTASDKVGKPTEIYSSEDFFPFYLAWSPDSKRVAFLAQSDNDLSLNYANADASEKKEMDRGSPFYFSWSPDSQTLLSHVGGSRRQSADAFVGLHSLADSGQPKHFTIAPANFLAPSWSPDGKQILMALMGSGSGDSLILTDKNGENATTLAKFSGIVSFNWSPDGKQIAYMVTQQIRGSLKRDLHVIKADGSDDQIAIEDSPLAFFWSPDSKKIAYLVRSNGDQGALQFVSDPQQQAPLRVTWNAVTLSDKKVVALSTFVPTDSFASILPYFDQYAQSLRLWSPDSTMLAYSASEKDNAEGIYVVNATGGADARRIAGGSMAVWSWH
jgi:Tol biopolymer transport system component